MDLCKSCLSDAGSEGEEMPSGPSILAGLSLPAPFSPPGPLTRDLRLASSLARLPLVSPLQTSPTWAQRHLLRKKSITPTKPLVLALLLTSSPAVQRVTPLLSASVIFFLPQMGHYSISFAELREANETPSPPQGCGTVPGT